MLAVPMVVVAMGAAPTRLEVAVHPRKVAGALTGAAAQPLAAEAQAEDRAAAVVAQSASQEHRASSRAATTTAVL